MTQRNNLYRRASGIYALRIIVPSHYRDLVGQNEIHTSTLCRDLRDAKAVASRLLNLWNSSLRDWGMIKSKPSGSDASAADRTLISIAELSSSSGLTHHELLRLLLSKNVPLVYEANCEPGFLVADVAEVERDSPEKGGFVLDSAMEIGIEHAFNRPLKVFNPRSTILSIIDSGFSEEVVFRIMRNKREAAFFDLPGIRLTPQNVLLLNIHAEMLEISLTLAPASRPLPSVSSPLSVLHVSEEPASASRRPNAVSAHNHYACECCRPDRAEEHVSTVLSAFLTRKQSSWKLEQQKKMETLCTTFVELMGDPLLGSLNRQMVWSYEAKLRKMPANRYSAARRHGTNDACLLLELAESLAEDRLSPKSVERYMDALSSMFAWAKQNMILTNNPAEGALEKSKKITRAQDDRQPFSESDLARIFSAQWFIDGTGERNSRGRFHQFRPHYYWLPLLGLYTGARLNELSQLYIADVRRTETGVHFLDLNLNSPDKTDLDGRDKSLKNVDSQRIVTLHPQIIELGFFDYIEALAKAGYQRVFPELKHDAIKGYGKPAGSWFNERFLGNHLSIPRDGKLTFHSFRHTFITALAELEVPSDIQSQLAGHSRGDTITSKRYRKDTGPERLLTYIRLLDFVLPPIKPFVISDGLEAVLEGLNRKQRRSNYR